MKPRFSMRPIPTCRLVPHPASQAPDGVSVSAGVERRSDGLWQLDFRIVDAHGCIRWPEGAEPGAVDGLWQHTCCEAFVAAPDSDAYVEFNVSPSGQWACYRFAAYRVRADEGQPAWHPAIEYGHHGRETTLSATIPPVLVPSGASQLGLSCVIETADGALSYWALAHPQAQPDFHHREGFALRFGKESAA